MQYHAAFVLQDGLFEKCGFSHHSYQPREVKPTWAENNRSREISATPDGYSLDDERNRWPNARSPVSGSVLTPKHG
jgi:hypothetical protein